MHPTEAKYARNSLGVKTIVDHNNPTVILHYFNGDLWFTHKFKNLSWSSRAIDQYLRFEYEFGYPCFIDYVELQR